MPISKKTTAKTKKVQRTSQSLSKRIAKKVATTRRPFLLGFTLIEIIVVTGILALLSIITVQGVVGYLARSRDTQRKADLHDIKVAFEDYFTDNQCYPKSSQMLECGSDVLSPYLKAVPCDPSSGEPYLYKPYPSDNNSCRGFRVYARLEQTSDQSIEALDCDGPLGCAVVHEGGVLNHNYGVSVGVAVSQKDEAITSGAAATAATEGFTCSAGGICNVCQFVSQNASEQCPANNVFVTVEDCQSACK